MLQEKLHALGDKLSNDEFDGIPNPEKIVDEALAELRSSWLRQLSPRKEDGFRLRMSNVGKPLCQLQMGASGAKPKRKSYNFKTQMMIGDAVEAIADIYLALAEVNVTSSKDEVKLDVGDVTINGTDDVEIDHKVYDIKSCSPWAFDNKWMYGYESLKQDDPFGYIGQLTGYAKAKGKEVGGWIVINKSTGQLVVVEADTSENEKVMNLFNIQNNVEAVTNNHPFERQFEAEPDKWRGKATGRKRLSKSCGFCDYVGSCWPTAKYEAHPDSTAKSPPHYWFVEDA